MKKTALIIQDLAIYKMPGFPSGIKPLRSFANHVNVIAGPNASGKSSTAQIIQDMIWKKNRNRIHVQSKFIIGDKKWDIQIDNGHYTSQSNGREDTLTSLPAYDEAKRYFLALHELIKEDDKNLAEEIVRETIGGYDLKKAQTQLGFKASTPTLGLTEYKNYEKQRRNEEEIRKKQADLQVKGLNIGELKEKYLKAKDAVQLSYFYAAYSDYLQAKENYDTLAIRETLYPEELAVLLGNEETVCKTLEENLKENNRAIETINIQIKAHQDDLAALNLPPEGYSRLLLDELSGHVEQLINLEGSLQRNRILLSKDETQTEVALNHLFTSLKSERLAALALEDIHDLDMFFEEAYQLLSKKQAFEQEIIHLQEKIQEFHHTEEVLHNGIRLLFNWFEKDANETETLKWLTWTLLFIALLVVPLTYYYDWYGFIGILIMLVIVLFKGRGGPKERAQQIRINDFKRIGLQEPSTWQEEAVSKRLEELHSELNYVKQQQEVNRRLNEINELLKELQPKWEALEMKRVEWMDKLGGIPELEVEQVNSYSGLYWFLKNLLKWQKHHNDLLANQRSYKKEEQLYKDLLAHINSKLEKVQVPSALDAASAKAILKAMNDGELSRETHLTACQSLEQRKNDLERMVVKDREDHSRIYDKLKLREGDYDGLLKLTAQKENYDEWRKEIELAQHRLVEKENQVKNHHLYANLELELNDLNIKEADTLKEHYVKLSAQAEILNTEIATLEAYIDKEKTGNELEKALAEKEASLDELEQSYLNTIGSLTGDLIVQGLAKRTQEHSKSNVFNRANELFNKITHGRYELILDDTEGGQFRGRDTVLNQGLPLEHLSSGTRIQLLIAVRLAFIESQESGIKLPILADEVLANSDDLRATQLIEALIEISKEGRQIFYFTAQSDEVKKWQEHLAKHPDVKGKIFELKGQTNERMDYTIQSQHQPPSLSLAQVPSPEGLSHQAYLEVLNPPVFRLLQDSSHQLHVAYLIEENNLLQACLERGVHYYGQLKSFTKHQGKLKGMNDAVLEEIHQKVSLLEIYQELYQQGRARPIDRAVLQESGSVSDTFIDAVDEKLKEVDYNPERLIEALKNREVGGFIQSKREDLQNYLTEKAYLDEREPLSSEEISIRVHAALSQMDLPENIADRFLKRIVK